MPSKIINLHNEPMLFFLPLQNVLTFHRLKKIDQIFRWKNPLARPRGLAMLACFLAWVMLRFFFKGQLGVPLGILGDYRGPTLGSGYIPRIPWIIDVFREAMRFSVLSCVVSGEIPKLAEPPRVWAIGKSEFSAPVAFEAFLLDLLCFKHYCCMESWHLMQLSTIQPTKHTNHPCGWNNPTTSNQLPAAKQPIHHEWVNQTEQFISHCCSFPSTWNP